MEKNELAAKPLSVSYLKMYGNVAARSAVIGPAGSGRQPAPAPLTPPEPAQPTQGPTAFNRPGAPK